MVLALLLLFLLMATNVQPKHRIVDGEVDVLVGIDSRCFGAEDEGVIILEFLDPDFGCDGQIVPA